MFMWCDKKKIERLTYNLHIFTPLEVINSQRVLKLPNLVQWHHKRGYDLPLDNEII